jgi:hypothetical protein
MHGAYDPLFMQQEVSARSETAALFARPVFLALLISQRQFKPRPELGLVTAVVTD